MPTYDYLCEDCSRQFEHFQSITSDALTECPSCKGHLRRLIGGGGALIFKGNGFFCTDYRKDSPRDKENSSEGKKSNESVDKD